MMRAILAIVLATSLTSIGAARDLVMVEGAYEVALGEIALPGGTAGTAIFKPCAECNSVALRVSDVTTYSVDGAALSLPDFGTRVDSLLQAGDANAAALVNVLYDLRTSRVTRISVHTGR